MMKMKLTTILTAAALAVASPSVAQQTLDSCGPVAEIIHDYQAGRGEIPMVWADLNTHGVALMILVNPLTNEFSAFFVGPSGTACIWGYGEDFGIVGETS